MLQFLTNSKNNKKEACKDKEKVYNDECQLNYYRNEDDFADKCLNYLNVFHPETVDQYVDNMNSASYTEMPEESDRKNFESFVRDKLTHNHVAFQTCYAAAANDSIQGGN